MSVLCYHRAVCKFRKYIRVCFSEMPLTFSGLEWHFYRHVCLEGDGYDQVCQVYADRAKGKDENGNIQGQNYRMYPLQKRSGNCDEGLGHTERHEEDVVIVL